MKKVLIIIIILILGLIAGILLSQLWRTHQQEPPDRLPPQDLVLIHQNTLIGVSIPCPLRFEVLAGIITKYNPTVEQCDSDPNINAMGQEVQEGDIANNCLPFGTTVEIDGEDYPVKDRMNERYGCEYFDILTFDEEEAKQFGRQEKNVRVY